MAEHNTALATLTILVGKICLTLGAAKDFGSREASSAAGAQFFALHIFCARKYCRRKKKREKPQGNGKLLACGTNSNPLLRAKLLVGAR